MAIDQKINEMSHIRSFIAIDLSKEIKNSIFQVSEQLKMEIGENLVKWVHVEKIHLTMKFLGDIPLTSVDNIKKQIQDEVSKYNQFVFNVGLLGAFPSIKRPRVIWLGIEAPRDLTALYAGLENRMVGLGINKEKRGFSPHLTLGRTSQKAATQDIKRISMVLGSNKVGYLGQNLVDHVTLYKSVLHSTGAEYTPLQVVELMNP